ncbi:hypothetical protein ACFQZ4_41470 [Catellatospora coxensis]|nr:hypothetical protein [Catellatospora coxensis]
MAAIVPRPAAALHPVHRQAPEYTRIKAELGVPDTCGASQVAARMSVDPAALGAHTRLEGRAVLALTECGRRYGYPPSGLDI